MCPRPIVHLAFNPNSISLPLRPYLKSTILWTLLTSSNTLSIFWLYHHHQNCLNFADSNLTTANVFDRNKSSTNATNMGWPFETGVISNYGEFERFENFSIEELLQQSCIPYGSIAEMQPPSRNGVLMISNVSYFSPYSVCADTSFNILLLTVVTIPRSRTP